MEDLLFSLRTVFPLLVMMGVGFAARRLQWVDDDSVRKLNGCVFRIFLPLLLCFNIVDTRLDAVSDTGALLYGLAAALTSFGLAFLLVPRFVRDRRSCGVVIQCLCRSNYAIFGIPLVLAMYPDADTSVAALMVAVAVPVFNVMSTIALMLYGGDRKPDAREVLRGVLLNPLIIGTVIGLILWRFQIPLPYLLDAPLRSLSKIATPLALFLLGASLDFTKARANAGLLAFSTLGRLVLSPLIFVTAAILLGFRDVPLATMVALFASPVAVSSFPMAQQLGGNDDLAGGQVVFTTALSVVTVFLWILALRLLGYLA